MNMLLDRHYLAHSRCEAHIPHRRRLMQHKTNNHQKDDARGDLEKERSKNRQRHLGELQQVQQRLLPAAGMLDMGGAMAEIIGKARRQPASSPILGSTAFSPARTQHYGD